MKLKFLLILALVSVCGAQINNGGGGGSSSGIGSGTSLPATPCTAGTDFILTGTGSNADIQFQCLGTNGGGNWIRIPTLNYANQVGATGQAHTVQASDYGVVTDQVRGDCSVPGGSGTNILTCPDGNFLVTCSPGQVAQASTYATGNVINATTILSCDSNTQVHTTANAVSSPTGGTVSFVWGQDNTTALGAAWTAASGGFVILAPGGYYWTTKAQFITGGPGGVIVPGPAWEVSYLFIPTNFDYTTCIGGPGTLDCFGGITSATFDGIGIYGGSVGNDAAANHFLFSNNGGYFSRVDVKGVCPGCSHIYGIVAEGVEPIFREGASEGTGNFACYFGADTAISIVSPCLGNAGQVRNPQHGMWVAGGSALSMGNVYGAAGVSGVEVQSGATFTDDGDKFTGGIINAGTHNVYNSLFAGGVTITNNSGGILKFQNTRMGSDAITNNAGGTLIDQCGNTGFGTVTNSGTWYNCKNANGAVIVTAAKLVLSAGWGTTAAWTALTGWNDFTGTITASGTGQAANPTITYTFANPYPAAPQNCQATILKSNDAGVTISNYALTPSSLTATGVVWTYTGTPVANDTYTVQGTCTN